MFHGRTLFVLGAGASVEAEMPSGPKLAAAAGLRRLRSRLRARRLECSRRAADDVPGARRRSRRKIVRPGSGGISRLHRVTSPHGLDADGRGRWGVLEPSWRIGGTSSAELVALGAFAD